MATVAAVSLIAGTGVQLYAQSKAAKNEEEAARAQADAKRQQAFDLAERFRINSESLRVDALAFAGDQSAASAELGRGDAPLLLLEETNLRAQSEINSKEFDLQANQRALFAGADINDKQADDIKTTAKIQAVGTFLNAAGKLGGGK